MGVGVLLHGSASCSTERTAGKSVSRVVRPVSVDTESSCVVARTPALQ